MTFVLSVDPGGETGVGASGWCYQNEDQILALGDVQNLRKFLTDWDTKKLPVDHVVVEGYFTNPNPKFAKANMGRKLPTVENIGTVKLWAEMNGIEWTEYMPVIKNAQAKMTQVFPKQGRKDVSHKLDAYNHGRYYLIKNHGALTALEKEMKEKGTL
jgi:hypothetical protein